MECEHKFDEEFVCIKCVLETDPFTREPCIFYEEKKKILKNDKEVIRDLEDLWLDPDVTSTAYKLYQQVTENKIYRSKMHKVILCACICRALGDCNVQNFLYYFNISEEDYKKGSRLIVMVLAHPLAVIK